MTFSIRFLDKPDSYPYEDPHTPAAEGEIVLGDHQETFEASFYCWGKGDYLLQWRNGIQRILDGHSASALITEYTGTTGNSHLVWWPMYLEGEFVLFRNQLLFFDQLLRPFDIQKWFEYIPERTLGHNISEWRVPYSSL